MVALGTARYYKKVERAVERKEETTAGYGRRLLSASLAPFIKALQQWLAETENRSAGSNHSVAPYLKLLPVEVVALVAAQGVLDCIGLRRSYPATCVYLGQLLEDEHRFRFLKKANPMLWRNILKTTKRDLYSRKRARVVFLMNREGVPYEAWGKDMKAKIGLILLTLFTQSTGLVEKVVLKEGLRHKSLLCPTAKTREWIQDYHRYAELITPFWLPTVEPPVDWVNPFGGGYDDEDLAPCVLVKRATSRYIREKLSKADMPDVYAAVNLMQRTAWKINKPVFEVMRTLWDASAEVAGLPAREDEPLPTKPIDIDTNEEARKAWRKRAAAVHKRNATAGSQRILAAKVLWLAEKFSKVEKFYFPYQLDFRGRTYCVPYFLHPQGPDLARSLLLFADGKPIQTNEAACWLAVYGANLFGVDKVSFEARRAWVNENLVKIGEVVEDPIANRWWTEADEPWQFLAWCYEWVGFVTQGFGFVTHLPVCVDGTNNGLQILSLLTRDEIGGAATNVVQVGDKPADVYQEVADRVINSLKAEAGSAVADHWLSFGVNRKTTKRPVMVLPYGGTFHSCGDYVREWYSEQCHVRGINKDEQEHTFAYTQALAKKIWEAIGFCVGRPREAMKWLQDCAAIFTEHGLPIQWTAPTGFPVLQEYTNTRLYRVETSFGRGARLQLALVEPGTTLSKPRQKNGVSPNFVHSLDAAALHTTVARSARRGLTQFCMIHDSYGVLAPDIPVLNQTLREVFADMFSEDLLNKLRDEWQSQLPEGVQLPPVPPYGSLDPKSVLTSAFFFA